MPSTSTISALVAKAPLLPCYCVAVCADVVALAETVAAIAARRPRMVAITNTFQQSLAGFSLARRVRAACPEALIVMGGANVTGVMARGLAQVFDCIDYFFDGEGDIVFPEF